jgi:hypothetical protein
MTADNQKSPEVQTAIHNKPIVDWISAFFIGTMMLLVTCVSISPLLIGVWLIYEGHEVRGYGLIGCWVWLIYIIISYKMIKASQKKKQQLKEKTPTNDVG